MAFIDKLTQACSGSRTLAWLLVINTIAAILLWLTALGTHLIGFDGGFATTWLALPADARSFAMRPWTLFTYMFVHTGPLHLIFNMLWLYWFGRMLSDIERPGTVMRLYVGGGIVGGILYVLVSVLTGKAPGAMLTGSSASVLAVMCAAGMRLPSMTLNLFLLGEVKLKWIALACIVLTLLGASGLPTQSAHLGGVLFGAGWVLVRRRGLRHFRMPRRRHRRSFTVKPAWQARRAMENKMPGQERLDQLLDKIRISGYESLSAKEKNELNYISSRLK